jgi:2-keto-4-pentenoate hydratase/2-oxohepta-3-ene-1,7-dioic acid hydratase in catechol pathway
VKLVTFTADDARERVGVLVDGERTVVDLHATYAGELVAAGAEPERADELARAVFADMVTLVGFGGWGVRLCSELAERARAAHALADVKLCVPLRPPRLRDCIAFETHVRNWRGEVPAAFFRNPTFYKGNHTTVVGPDEDVPWPPYSDERDYELELGVVIGPSGVDVALEDAESHIYGLTCFNDWSARDVLRDEAAVGLGPAKAKDFATSLGPWLVTVDEIGDLYDLEMCARVNGEVWSTGSTRDIHWRFDRIIERMSQSEPLLSGEVFGSGTVANGCGLELGRYLEPGDVVELEIAGLGVLRNRVTQPRQEERP